MKHRIRYLLMLHQITLLSSPVSVPDGGTGFTTTTAYAILCGGTTNINPLQPIASLGTTGNPLVSNGTSSLPSFQTLTIAGGGTGATSLAAGVIQSNGSVLSSLGIGSANQVLQNSAGTVGWALTGVLQIASTATSSLVDTSGGSAIPDDDTIPQFSEGTLILSLSFTPKSASSNLFIIFATGGTAASSSAAVVALFVNSGPNAIAASYVGQRSASDAYAGVLQYATTSGSTTARTYQIRIGGGTYQINGSSGAARRFGGVASTILVVIEYI